MTPARTTLLGFVAALLLAAPSALAASYRTISEAEYLDKMKGGWAGQMIGVAYGSVYEFRSNGKPILEPLREWKPEYVSNALQQDDIYVEMTFLKSLVDHGVKCSQRQAALDFGQSKYRLWHANQYGRENIRKGIMPPLSGHPKYNEHADDIDFQIEADLFGLISPGLPEASQAFCDRFGHLMNYGDGVYGGNFVTAMYGAAFFEKDPHELVRIGLQALPPGSKYAAVIRDVLKWYEEYPTDWLKTWQLLEDKWAKEDKCPDGKGRDFNIDAKINGAYIAIGLLYGEGDLERTMEITTRCGQDADCNPSSAAGILATTLGYKAIPDRFTSGIPALKGQKFEYTAYDFDGLVEACAKVAREVIRSQGGSIIDAAGAVTYRIPIQRLRAPKLEQWQ